MQQSANVGGGPRRSSFVSVASSTCSGRRVCMGSARGAQVRVQVPLRHDVATAKRAVLATHSQVVPRSRDAGGDERSWVRTQAMGTAAPGC
jgi:hypothetical protein